MTPPPAADRPGRPGTGPRPGAGWSPPPSWPARGDGDTGPVPIVGGRPGPPPSRDDAPTAAVPPVVDDAPTAAVPPVVDDVPTAAVARVDDDPDDADLDEEDELPTTERPAGGRAGRNLRQAVTVGLSLGAVIIVSRLVGRPAFVGGVPAAVLVAVVERPGALRAGRFRPPLVPLLVGSVAMEALAWTRGE